MSQPIEDQLKSQLVDMIRDCQVRVSNKFRSRISSSRDGTPSGSTPWVSPDQAIQNIAATQEAGHESFGFLETFDKEPPTLNPSYTVPDFTVADSGSQHPHTNPFESDDSSGRSISILGPSLDIEWSRVTLVYPAHLWIISIIQKRMNYFGILQSITQKQMTACKLCLILTLTPWSHLRI